MNQQVAQAVTPAAIVPGDRLKARDLSQYSYDDLLKAVKKRVRLNVAPGLVEQFLGRPSIQAGVAAYVADHIKRYGHDRDIILTKEELEERTRQSNAQALVDTFLKTFKGEDPKRQVADQNEVYRAMRVQVSMRKIDVRDPDSLTTVIGRYLSDNKIISISARDNENFLNRTKVTPEVVQALKDRLVNAGL